MNINERKGLLYYLGLDEIGHRNGPEKYYFFLVLYLSFSLFASQNFLAPNLRLIAASFSIFSQTEIDFYAGGIVPLFSFSAGSISAIIIVLFIKKYTENWLLLVISLAGQIFSILTSFSDSYIVFLICSAGAGAMTGAFFPLYFSSIGSIFSEKSRLTAISYASAAMGLGIGAGQILGGMLADRYGLLGWRICYTLLSAPAVFFTVVYFMIFRNHIHKHSAQIISDGYSRRFDTAVLRKLFSSRSNIGILLQGIPGCIPWGVFNVFMMDYCETSFGMSKMQATGIVSLMGIGVLAGTFFGGILGQKIYNYKKTYLPLFIMASIFLGTVPAWFLLSPPNMIGLGLYYPLLSFFAGFTAGLPASNINGITAAVNGKEERITVFALLNVLENLGKGGGPVIVSLLLSVIPDRKTAFLVSVLFWIPASLLWLPVLFNFENDEKVYGIRKEGTET